MCYPHEIHVNFHFSINYESKLESVIKQEPLDPMSLSQNASKMSQPVPIKLEDLDGIGKYGMKELFF